MKAINSIFWVSRVKLHENVNRHVSPLKMLFFLFETKALESDVGSEHASREDVIEKPTSLRNRLFAWYNLFRTLTYLTKYNCIVYIVTCITRQYKTK